MHQHCWGMLWGALLQTAWKSLVPVHAVGCHHSRSCWKLILRLAEHIIQYFQNFGVWASSEMQKNLAVAMILVTLVTHLLCNRSCKHTRELTAPCHFLLLEHYLGSEQSNVQDLKGSFWALMAFIHKPENELRLVLVHNSTNRRTSEKLFRKEPFKSLQYHAFSSAFSLAKEYFASSTRNYHIFFQSFSLNCFPKRWTLKTLQTDHQILTTKWANQRGTALSNTNFNK